MSINYQRRDFMRRAFYVGLSVGLPQPVLAAIGTTSEEWRHQVSTQYFRWKVSAVIPPPHFIFYKGGDTIDFGNRIKTTRTPQVSDDGVFWRDAELYEIGDKVVYEIDDEDVVVNDDA